MKPEPVAAIVVAAGSGVRLGDSTAGGTGPKALRLLAGKPLVTWSVDAMAAGGCSQAIVVIPAGAQATFLEALAEAPIPVTLVEGGATRQESVYRGLAGLPSRRCRIILVHDAARPLVPADVVRSVIDAVLAGAKAVVPVIAVHDTIRRLDADGSTVVDRESLRAVQTPQGFDLGTLLLAHELAVGESYTDDAAVCEANGARVLLVQGSRRSAKITEPADFAFAEALLKETP